MLNIYGPLILEVLVQVCHG